MIWVVFVAALSLSAAIPYTGDQNEEDPASFRDEAAPFSDLRDDAGNLLTPPAEIQNQIAAGKMDMDDDQPQRSVSNIGSVLSEMAKAAEIDTKDSAFTLGDLIKPGQVAAQTVLNGLSSKQLGNLELPSSIPGLSAEDMMNLPKIDLSNPDAVVNARAIAPPSIPAMIPMNRVLSHMPTDKIAEKSFSDLAGFPTIEHIFQSLDDKVNTARTVWDRIMGQADIQEETRVGIERTTNAIADAELTNQAVKNAEQKADTSVTADHDALTSANTAYDFASKVVQDDVDIQEAAKEAKRWMDKVLERSTQAGVDSAAAQKEMDHAKKMADESLARDVAVQAQMKDVLVESSRAIKEASDAKEKLLQLQKHEQWVMNDAAQAKRSLLEVKKGEQALREQEEKLHNLLVAEEASKAHAEKELETLRATFEKQMEEIKVEKTRLEGEKLGFENKLKDATTELQRAQAEVELKHKEIELLEKSGKEEQDRQQVQQAALKSALEESRQAKEEAAAAVLKQKEAEAKAARLEQERQFVQTRMQEKLTEAKRRTKEWLKTQMLQVAKEEEAKDAEIQRLRLELENLEKEERERRGLDLAVAQQQLAALHAQEKIQAQIQLGMQQQQLQHQQPVAPKHAVPMTTSPLDTTALQLGESAEPMPTKEQVYAQMMAAHDKVKQLLLKATGALMPDTLLSATAQNIPRTPYHAQTAQMDLESNPSKLSRRKGLSPRTVDALPLGYPPPHGTVKMHAPDMINLELDEGYAPGGHGPPITAQGVNPEVPILSPAHRDNCVKICSGGDATVYRDGQVSTDPADARSVHTPGACMRMCAMFTIDAKADCADKATPKL